MLFWKKMPSLWIGSRITEFNTLDTAKAIAALKIYIVFCLFGKEELNGVRTVCLTFTELTRIASLSRSLVSEGLKILFKKGLIKNLCMTPRKKIYTVDVDGKLNDGWCKLPFKGLVDEEKNINSFQSMHNRYPFELIALQAYLYLLYARDNKYEYTLARKKTICDKLNCTLPDLNKALTYLLHIGLMDHMAKKSVEFYTTELFHDSFYFFPKTGGSSALTYRKLPVLTTPPPITLEQPADSDDIDF
ncbi:MAG TPA: hypothetical protein VGL07_16870 [Buttiauxella sp.]|jgi:hypothetical protein